VSGIIAAVKNNGKGLAGLADRVNLLELRCFDSKTTSTSNIVSAIAYAIQQKADVINMSFGGTKQSLAESLREQIDKAAEQGIIMVSAAGNGEYGDTVSLNYPAAFDSVVGVGMVDKTGVVAPNSQKNSSVYVTAPGVEIPGLGNTSTDAYVSSGTGTSYAAPIVTSLAAMAKQTNKEINGEGFKKLLRDCAVDDASLNGYDTSYGYGVVNARLMAEALTKDYSIVYNCNGGVLTGTEGIDYPVSFKIGRSEEIYLPIPVRSGYKFAGWYDNASLTGGSISKGCR
jgi:subtilisin family serine protease